MIFRSFLTELSNILINEANDTIIGLLGRYNADQLEIPEEEVWQVEVPVWPEPEPEPEPEPGQYLESSCLLNLYNVKYLASYRTTN